MNAASKKEVGHMFLARLGRKRLRPGGIRATNWLLAQAGLGPDTAVLEVACNRCITSVELVQQYGCRVVAVDMDAKVLEQARRHVREQGAEDCITIVQANALKLPFEDGSFDVVVNKTMLTMLQAPAKAKTIAEYYRVLKPGGSSRLVDPKVTQQDFR